MNIPEVLDRAWQIVWKHKVLWIFGILAGCAHGGGGGFGSGTGWRGTPPNGSAAAADVDRFFSGIGQWVGAHLWVLALFALLMVAAVVLAMFLGTMGRIGLIRGVRDADHGAARLAFGDLFRGGLPYFWRVFGLTFLVGLAFVAIFIPLMLFGVLTAGVGFLCVLPLLCILLPLAWAVNILVRLASVAMVVEDLGPMQGVRSAWQVASKKVGPVLVIWLSTALLGLVVGFVIALPVLLLAIAAAIGFFATGQGMATTLLLAGGVCLTIYLPVMVVAGGVLTAYIESVWTLTYLRLSQRGHEAEGLVPSPANA